MNTTATSTPTTLSGRAYETIRRRILTGELAAGAVISEHSLAREIGISRTPVREAVQQLERDGLVEQVPRYGTIVRRPERRDIVELYELREALECFAVRRAGEAIDAAGLDMLRKLCDEMAALTDSLAGSGGRLLDAASMRRFLAADMAFHMVILRATGNRRIIKSVAESRVLARIFGTPRQEHDLAVLRETQRFHQAILRAIERRQGEAAEELMRDHIQASLREALEHFDKAADQRRSAESLGPLDLPPDLMDELSDIAHARPRKKKTPRRAAESPRKR